MHLIANSLLAAQTWFLAQTATTTTDTTVYSPSGNLSHGLIYTLLIGFVVGIIAKFLTPGRDPGGCIITSLIGIAGAFIAYFIGRAFGHYGAGQTPGIIASVIGAIILLVIYHATIGIGPRGGTGGGPTI